MLAFDSEVYGILLAQYGAAIWPWQLAALLVALTFLVLIRRPFVGLGRMVAGFLAVVWAWSGLRFHIDTFAAINFVAPVVGAALVLQALLLAASGVAGGTVKPRFTHTPTAWIGLGIAVVGLIGYPIVGLPACEALTGVPPYKAAPGLGTTGIAAGLVTLGILVMNEGRTPWHLVAIPLFWLVAAGVAAWCLGMVDSPILLACAGLAFCAILWKNHGRRLIQA